MHSHPSRRESRNLELLMEGRSNKEMASALQLSVDTVKFHLKTCIVSSKPKAELRLSWPAPNSGTWSGSITMPFYEEAGALHVHTCCRPGRSRICFRHGEAAPDRWRRFVVTRSGR